MPTLEIGHGPGSREGEAGLDIAMGRRGTTAVLTLAGELDMHTVPRLRMRLAAALAQGDASVLVDLTGITFMDSTGLAALVSGMRRARRSGGSLVLITPGGPVLRMLRITNLDSMFDVHPTLDAALGSGGTPHPVAA
jgi:anti-sigma B factor antagonist